jgi:hypothetical protein
MFATITNVLPEGFSVTVLVNPVPAMMLAGAGEPL